MLEDTEFQKFIPQQKLYGHHTYTVPDILMSRTYCYITPKYKSHIPNCVFLKSMYYKIYQFDSMEAKLFEIAATTMLSHNSIILATNDKDFLETYFTNSKSLGMQMTNRFFTSAYSITEDRIILNLSPGLASNLALPNPIESGLDDLYNKIPKSITHYVMHHHLSSSAPNHPIALPYNTEEMKRAFIKTSKKILTNLLSNDDISKNISPNHFSYETLKATLCNSYEYLHLKLVNTYMSSTPNLKIIDKVEMLKTLSDAYCLTKTVHGIHAEIITRHYEQIANGLQTNIGVHHQDLPYVQPLVEYTKKHLHPIFDDYLKHQCHSQNYDCTYNNEELQITFGEMEL